MRQQRLDDMLLGVTINMLMREWQDSNYHGTHTLNEYTCLKYPELYKRITLYEQELNNDKGDE